MKLIVQLAVWNGKKYLPYLFESLSLQTMRDWHLLILDNDSQDGSGDWLSSNAMVCGVTYSLKKETKNCGFAGGHNLLFNSTSASFPGAEYVVLLNQDMYVEPDCFEKITAFAERHRDAGAVSARLMRWNFLKLEGAGASSLSESKTNMIDTLGLKARPTRRVADWMTGREFSDALLAPHARRRIDGAIEVFGVSGALPLYRIDAIKSSACDGNIFDADYGSYKEDVDLAWRLRLSGWRAFTVLDAIAYHDRTAAGPYDESDKAARAHYLLKPDYVRFQSYRNHLITLFKNELWQNTLIDAPQIFLYELKKIAYLLIYDRILAFRAWCDIFKMCARIIRNRRKIMQSKRISWISLRSWWDS